MYTNYPSQARIEDLIDIFNTLDNRDLSFLISLITASERCNVYIGTLANHCITFELDDACLNGTTVQINLKSSHLDDLSDDPFFKCALDKYAENQSPRAAKLNKRKARAMN
jgi:hypothetical protein